MVRINTELVQTGVTVLDKQGRFVDGLKPEQFEVRVAVCDTATGRVGSAAQFVNSPPRKVSIDPNADASRIPYGADIALQTLPSGRYLLQVKITDRKANTSSTQQAIFDID